MYFTVGDLTMRNTYFFNKIHKNSDFFLKEKHQKNIGSINEFL